MQERRRIWLQKQRRKYYESLSRWRRPKIIISETNRRKPTAAVIRNHRPPQFSRRPSEENRRHYDNPANSQRGESTSLMRSLLGVNPFCVHDEAQFSCTFTPLCWMQGGVAMSGCDSMLYSCCVSHTIARRQVGIFEFTIVLLHIRNCAANFKIKLELETQKICRLMSVI